MLLNIRRDRHRDHWPTKRGAFRALDDSIIEGGYNLVRSRIAEPFGSISYALGAQSCPKLITIFSWGNASQFYQR